MKGNDGLLTKIYKLVENDESGRELLLKLLNSSDSHQYYNNFYEFLRHVADRDIKRSGPLGSRRVLRHDLFVIMGSFVYLCEKVTLAGEAIKKANYEALDAVSSSRDEGELEKCSKNQGMFGIFASTKRHCLSMHADLQNDFSQEYNFRSDVLNVLDMGSLALMGEKTIKPKKMDLKEKTSEKKKKVAKKTSKRKPHKKSKKRFSKIPKKTKKA